MQFYSVREGELSGRGSLPTVGLPFFTAVAPCMDNPAVKGRIDAAIANGKLDADILHVGDFSDRDRPLRIRAQSASGGGVWLFLQREAA